MCFLFFWPENRLIYINAITTGFIRGDGHDQVVSANDPYQEHKTLYTYTLGVSSIPFSTSSNGYNQYPCFAKKYT